VPREVQLPQFGATARALRPSHRTLLRTRGRPGRTCGNAPSRAGRHVEHTRLRTRGTSRRTPATEPAAQVRPDGWAGIAASPSHDIFPRSPDRGGCRRPCLQHSPRQGMHLRIWCTPAHSVVQLQCSGSPRRRWSRQAPGGSKASLASSSCISPAECPLVHRCNCNSRTAAPTAVRYAYRGLRRHWEGRSAERTAPRPSAHQISDAGSAPAAEWRWSCGAAPAQQETCC
jgi:hypothetical protein